MLSLQWDSLMFISDWAAEMSVPSILEASMDVFRVISHVNHRVMGGVSECLIQLRNAISWTAAIVMVSFLLCVFACVLAFFLFWLYLWIYVSCAQRGALNARAYSLLSSTQSKPPVGTSIIAWHREGSMKQQLETLMCPVWGEESEMLLRLIHTILSMQVHLLNHRFQAKIQFWKRCCVK